MPAPPELPPALAELPAFAVLDTFLRPRQARFVREFYSCGRNAAEAARRAGYSSDGANAKASGWALRHRRSKVAAAIRRIDRQLASRFAYQFARATANAGTDQRTAALASAQLDQLYSLLPQDILSCDGAPVCGSRRAELP